jgi:hypothetical protein
MKLKDRQYANLKSLYTLLSVKAFHYYMRDYNAKYDLSLGPYSQKQYPLFGNGWLTSVVGFAAYNGLTHSLDNSILKWEKGEPALNRRIVWVSSDEGGKTLYGEEAVLKAFGQAFLHNIYMGDGAFTKPPMSVAEYVKYVKETIAIMLDKHDEDLENDALAARLKAERIGLIDVEEGVLPLDEDEHYLIDNYEKIYPFSVVTPEPDAQPNLEFIYTRAMYDNKINQLKLAETYFQIGKDQINNMLENAAVDQLNDGPSPSVANFSIHDLDQIILDGIDIPKDRMTLQSKAMYRLMKAYINAGWNVAITKDMTNPTLVFKL